MNRTVISVAMIIVMAMLTLTPSVAAASNDGECDPPTTVNQCVDGVIRYAGDMVDFALAAAQNVYHLAVTTAFGVVDAVEKAVCGSGGC